MDTPKLILIILWCLVAVALLIVLTELAALLWSIKLEAIKVPVAH